MMKSLLKIFSICVILTLTACTSYRKVPYIQNHEYANSLNQMTELYDAKIMPKDILTITVNTSDPSASAHFNLGRSISIENDKASTQGSLESYLVDNDGTIDFPILGRLHVAGLTKNECENMIKERLKTYLKETPVVMVRMPEFKITVLGEVNGPGQFTVKNEKINVLEALALAGDMSIYGRRDNVKLIREDSRGKRHIYTMDVTDATLIYNPLYQLQQNDVIYVTPNKTKARAAGTGGATQIWFSAASMFISIASLVTYIIRIR